MFTRGASDLILGAEKNGDSVYFVLTAEKDWEGKLVFDAPTAQNHPAPAHRLPED